MSKNNFWCSEHRDENGDHKECNLCDNKGRCQSVIEKIFCPNTGEQLKKMGETMSGGYAKFGSLPSNEKQKILRKRSHEHFKTHIEEKKVHMNRQVDPGYEPPKTK